MKNFIIIFVFLLSSCAHKNNVVVDNIEFSPTFIDQGNSQLDKQWWHTYNNEELTQFITQGLKENLSLKARDLRLKSSAIEIKISGADHYPDLNLAASATSDFNQLSDINSASLGITSSWELDIWGSIAANENKSYWEFQNQEALYRARANLVAGNIATAWFNLVSEQEKKIVLDGQFKRTKDALTVISRRFALGKNSVTNIWQQQKLLKSIEVQQAKNFTDLYLHQQTLALWLGIPTAELKPINLTRLPQLPTLPKMGIPAQVLKYRPDVESSFAKIKSANENLAIAVAEQYPRITLRANYSTSQNAFKDIFDDWAGNLIGSLTMPLLDAGKNKLVIEQRELALKALLLDYQQVWLEAIASVNQVLINEAQLVKVANNLALQLDLADRTEKLITIKYLNGKTNYIELLKAQESILALERQHIDANRKLVTNRVLLYRELSHGDFSLVSELNNDNKGKPL